MNKKTYNDVMSEKSDNNIHFNDFRNLIVDLGFDFIRQNGSHMQYFHCGHHVFMNIQNDGSKAKGYEVRQLRKIILKFGL
ncbi:MAG: type II toxin-antitoxin system HicA family toxin [Lachnospiraceae bacterium]|nr:type II toxin-antitoxin system HicA family toxin [Lachnospiraceae bacterium]